MAEYKNGVNYRGNMSVSASDVNSEVQTGRAVFVDEDKYEKDADYKAKVDKCVEEGFHKVTENGSSGEGGEGGPVVIGGGTLVIKQHHTDGTFPNVNTVFNKTWQEVHDALGAGIQVIVAFPSIPSLAEQMLVLHAFKQDTQWVAEGILASSSARSSNLYACSADGFLQTAECQEGQDSM